MWRGYGWGRVYGMCRDYRRGEGHHIVEKGGVELWVRLPGGKVVEEAEEVGGLRGTEEVCGGREGRRCREKVSMVKGKLKLVHGGARQRLRIDLYRTGSGLYCAVMLT